MCRADSGQAKRELNKDTDLNNRSIGASKEREAAEYLAARGYRILEQNFHCRRGEIDIIAWQNGMMVFVEVKYRSGKKSGMPGEAVNKTKQRRIVCAAKQYLVQEGLWEQTACRFDVIAICGDEIVHYRNAFLS